MSNATKPDRYIYLDVEGIDSLHAQIVERVEASGTKSNARDRNSRISGGVGLGNAIGSLFGLLNLKGEAETASSRATSSTITTYHATEQKFRDLIEHLEHLGKPTIFASVTEAASFSKSEKDAVFIHSQIEFDLPQFTSGNGVAEVNEAKCVMFERNTQRTDNYNPRDDYYKEQRIPLVMSASLAKFPNCRGQMGFTGHEAVFFRGHGGRKVPLWVFGSLFQLPELCQIKPYAIWW